METLAVVLLVGAVLAGIATLALGISSDRASRRLTG
jgi:hypothetical protein